MKMNIAKALIRELPLKIDDAARLIMEIVEGLGDSVVDLTRVEMLALLRRVSAEGVRVVRESGHTVSFKEAAMASLAARKDRRPTTRRDLRHFIGRMLRVEGVASRPLRAMGVAECRQLLEKAFPNSPHSYRKGRVILSSIFSYGVRHEWCDRNPIQSIETPRVVERPIVPLSPEEVERLEQAAERPEHREMQLSLKLMLYCGLRPAEVMRFNPQRDIVENEIVVRARTSKTGGGRMVPLRKVTDFVHRHRDRLIIPLRWEQRWKALRYAARFTFWQADACRHTFASYHARYFRNIPLLQSEMGHTSTRLLYSRYVSPISAASARRFWRLKE